MRDYNLQNLTDLSHTLILNLPTQPKTVVDMTCGNGHDTIFLAKHYPIVYAFDVQQKAIINTINLLKGFQNIKIIQDDHYNFDKYINIVDLFVFNLGWLPNSNKQTKTSAEKINPTLDKCIKHLSNKGNILIISYNGEKTQQQETLEIQKFVEKSNLLTCQKISLINLKNPPTIWLIACKQ